MSSLSKIFIFMPITFAAVAAIIDCVIQKKLRKPRAQDKADLQYWPNLRLWAFAGLLGLITWGLWVIVYLMIQKEGLWYELPPYVASILIVGMAIYGIIRLAGEE